MHKKAMLMVSLWAIVLLFSVGLPAMSWADGWYLMRAPLKDKKMGYKPNLSKPLKLWKQIRSFDSASECETQYKRELSGMVALAVAASVDYKGPFNELSDATELYLLSGDSSKIPDHLKKPIFQVVIDYLPGYMCIATDDPRLK